MRRIKIVQMVSSEIRSLYRDKDDLKCHRLFRPKISEVKTSVVGQIRQVSNTLMQTRHLGGPQEQLSESKSP